MQTLRVAAFLAAWQQTGALTVSTTAESWLRAHSHGAPSGDELAELKTENPMAYGLVKALLMKRSLGLLDPRHPTASFAVAKAPAEEVPGAEAFREMGRESGDAPKAAALYPDAPMPTAHHNWMNWKPEQSATDDEAMVNNVLGSVAQLKGGSAGTSAQSGEGDALTWSNPSLTGPASIAPLAVVAAPPAAAASPPSQENSYLKGLDLGGMTQPSAAAKSSDSAAQSSGSFLTSFSWDDKEPAAKPQVAASAPAASGATEGKKPKNALLSWLR